MIQACDTLAAEQWVKLWASWRHTRWAVLSLLRYIVLEHRTQDEGERLWGASWSEASVCVGTSLWMYKTPSGIVGASLWTHRETSALFLASTVSTMHTNSHIWNASHPLVVTSTAESLCTHPSWRPKKSYGSTDGNRTTNSRHRPHPSNHSAHNIRIPRELLFILSNANFLNYKSQLVWERKNSVDFENNESFMYISFKLYMQVYTVCLNQQWLVIFLLASYV